MTGTKISATRPIRLTPPKITTPDKVTVMMPVKVLSRPKPLYSASLIELLCTALNTKPKASNKLKAKAMPNGREPKPC